MWDSFAYSNDYALYITRLHLKFNIIQRIQRIIYFKSCQSVGIVFYVRLTCQKQARRCLMKYADAEQQVLLSSRNVCAALRHAVLNMRLVVNKFTEGGRRGG